MALLAQLPSPLHHGKATLGPRNIFSSSKLNYLHVKRVRALFKQLHICCGFCHFSSQVTVNQCSCQQNWSLLWKDNSSSTIEGVGGDHCHFACSVPAYYIKAHFVLCQGYKTLHWCPSYWRLGMLPFPWLSREHVLYAAWSSKAATRHGLFIQKPPH